MPDKKRRVYLICPVRRCTPEVLAEMDAYVADLEARGYEVHYPPRDVDQRNDDGGVRICMEHREAMLGADEVHVWWDPTSYGCHFDLGMAYAESQARFEHGRPRMKFVAANQVSPVQEKSFQNLLSMLVTSGDC